MKKFLPLIFFVAALVPTIVSAQCPTLTLTLALGSRDKQTKGEVSLLQEFLRTENASSTQLVSGYFGALTAENLAEFQADRNIPVSSSTDPTTRAAILASCAASIPDSAAPAPSVTASFDQNHFTSLSSTPTLAGKSQGGNILRLRITRDHESPVFENIFLASPRWKVNVFPPLSTGVYDASLYADTTLLATSTFTVGLQAVPIIDLGYLPSFDVADGILIRFGVRSSLGPIALDRFTFAFSSVAADISQLSLKIFDDSSYSTFATSTFAGGVVNASPLDPINSLVTIVPDKPIEIAEGQSYYFELDGQVSPSDTSYSVNTSLLGDSTETTTTATVSQLAPNANFLWSPNTYGIASTTDADWINSSQLGTLPAHGILQVRTNAPGAPFCNLYSSMDTASPGKTIIISWDSQNATYSIWSDGSRGDISGQRKVVMGSQPTIYFINVVGPAGTASCSVTVSLPGSIAVPAPVSPAPPIVVLPPATTTSSFNFSLSNTGDKTVIAGSSITNVIAASLVSGTTQGISFTVSGFSSGVMSAFSASSCNPTCATTLSATTTLGTPAGTYPVTVTATGGGLSKTTSFNLAVSAAPPPPPATSTLAYFTATPTTIVVSSPVTFAGSVNNTKLCTAQKYYLAYGDNSTSTINVSNNVCKAQSFSFNHSYSKVGTFSSRLYLVTSTSTPLLQIQPITVIAKTAFLQNGSNIANTFYSAGIRFREAVQNFFKLFK